MQASLTSYSTNADDLHSAVESLELIFKRLQNIQFFERIDRPAASLIIIRIQSAHWFDILAPAKFDRIRLGYLSLRPHHFNFESHQKLPSLNLDTILRKIRPVVKRL